MLSADRIAEEWEGLHAKSEEREAQEREANGAQCKASEAVAVASVESATQAIDVDVGCEPVERRSPTGMDHGSPLSAENDRMLTKKSGHDGEESIANGEAVSPDNVHRLGEREEDQEITRDPTEGLGSDGGVAENADSKAGTELCEDFLDGKCMDEDNDAMAVSKGYHGRHSAEEHTSVVRGVTTSTTGGLQSNALSRPNVDLLETSDTESSDGDRARWPIGSGQVDGTESSPDLASNPRDACSEDVHGDKDAVVSWVVGRMGLLEKVSL